MSCRSLKFFTWLAFSNYLISHGAFYCPPINGPEGTTIICNLPGDKQELNCSSTWLPQGTSIRFKCTENGRVRKGRLRCNGNGKLGNASITLNSHTNASLPCGMYEDPSVSQIHSFGYRNPELYETQMDRNIQLPHNEDYKVYGLDLHNVYRSYHEAHPLKLDENLITKAQLWADHLSAQDVLDLSPVQSLGQNVFRSKLKVKTSAVNEALQFWYQEGIKHYNWTYIPANWDNPVALDFSQMIWNSSRLLGLATSSKVLPDKAAESQTFVVAFYFPMGNIVLENTPQPETLFLENVFPSK